MYAILLLNANVNIMACIHADTNKCGIGWAN